MGHVAFLARFWQGRAVTMSRTAMHKDRPAFPARPSGDQTHVAADG